MRKEEEEGEEGREEKDLRGGDVERLYMELVEGRGGGREEGGKGVVWGRDNLVSATDFLQIVTPRVYF